MKKKLLLLTFAFLFLTVSILPYLSAYAESEEKSVVLTINAINKTGAEGHSLIITPSYQKILSSTAVGFSWWKTATFEWDSDQSAYVVRSLNLVVDGVTGKNNIVPENGFVLAANIGNDYGNISYINKISTDCYYDLDKLEVGDKAYLTGVDIAAGTIVTSGGLHYVSGFTSDAKIYIGSMPEDADIYSPAKTYQLDMPVITTPDKAAVSQGINIEWGEVEGADSYTISINDGTFVPDGPVIVNRQKVTSNSFILGAEKVSAGKKYTILITARSGDSGFSYTARLTVGVVDDIALDSPFKDKKVMAFGDSITYRPGWVAMLSGKLGVDVINAGVGGDKTTEAVARLQDDIISQSPDIVFILFGMNDQAVNISNSVPLVSKLAYERNYRSIIEKIHAAGGEAVLLTGNNVCVDSGYYSPGLYNLNYGTGLLSEYYDILRALAEEYNLNIIDINKRLDDEGVTDKTVCAPGDGIHLSTEGQALFADYIAEYMFSDYFEGGYKEKGGEESKPEEEISADQSSNEEQSSIAEQSSYPEQSAQTSQTESKPEENEGRVVKAVIIALVLLASAALGFSFFKRKRQ